MDRTRKRSFNTNVGIPMSHIICSLRAYTIALTVSYEEGSVSFLHGKINTHQMFFILEIPFDK